MRRLSVLCVAFLAYVGCVFSQTHYHSNVSVGVKGGVDMSRVFFNPSVPQDFAFGYVAGFTFRYIEESHFGLIAELNLTRRGWKENFETARQYSYSRHIDYLSLPVLAHIYFGRRGRFFFNAGPEFSLFLGESTSSNFNPVDIPTLPDFPTRYRTIAQMTTPVSQKFDYGISAGLGGEFSVTRRHAVSVEARFYYGLGNILPSARRDYFSGSNQMTISATATYWFRIK